MAICISHLFTFTHHRIPIQSSNYLPLHYHRVQDILPRKNIHEDIRHYNNIPHRHEYNNHLSLVCHRHYIFSYLHAELQINQAEFYGGGVAPSPIFNHYPYVLEVVPSTEYVNVLPDETIDLTVDTRFDAVRVAAVLDFNPTHVDRLVTINESSSLDMQVDATVPMRFNVPGVYYTDTLDLSLSDITAPDLVKEILLTILFDSEIPFNLSGQLYTLNSNSGHVTDSLLTHAMHLNGSFDGNKVRTTAEISLTHDRLAHLLAADKLIIRFGVDTDNKDVVLNLDNGIGLTLKADVIYGGSVDVND